MKILNESSFIFIIYALKYTVLVLVDARLSHESIFERFCHFVVQKRTKDDSF